MHLFVALGSHPKMNVLLNAAARRAAQLGVAWHVVYVETPQHALRGEAHQHMVLRHMTRAEEMGAVIHRIEARDVLRGLASYIRQCEDEAVECWLGRPAEGAVGSWFHSPIYVRLHREVDAKRVALNAVPLHGRDLSTSVRTDLFRMRAVRLRHLFYAVLSVLAAYAVTEGLRSTMSVAEFRAASYNASLVFMVPPMVMALRFGLVAGLIAAAGSFVTLNYFYIQPIHRLSIDQYHDMVNVVLFVGIALVMALLGSYSYAYADSIRRRERRIRALFAMNGVISRATTRDEALEVIHQQVAELLEMDVALFLPPTLNPDGLDLVYPPTMESLEDGDWEAAHDCWQSIRTAGCGTARFRRSRWRFCPMITAHDRFGVLGVRIPPRCDVDATFGQLLTVLADQAANVLERIELSQVIEAKHISQEREKLRSMLLSSVSHDLKTPLASVIGSLGAYHGMYDQLPEDKKQELTQTALAEALRLESFITNILDMTRIESGHVTFRPEWIDPCALVKQVCKRLEQRLQNHRVEVVTPSQTMMVETDRVVGEQMVQNLLDNAAKYTPAGSVIRVDVAVVNAQLHVRFCDDGPGVPAEKLAVVFDKYERIRQEDRTVAGTGLGLAIVKAVMEAQGGQVTVHNAPEGGAVFTLIFPHYRVGDAEQLAVA